MQPAKCFHKHGVATSTIAARAPLPRSLSRGSPLLNGLWCPLRKEDTREQHEWNTFNGKLCSVWSAGD
jgi:hypothetical protein